MNFSDVRERQISAIYILGNGDSKSKVHIPSEDGILLISANESAIEVADVVVHTNPDISADNLQSQVKRDAFVVSASPGEINSRVIPVATRSSFEVTSTDLISDFFSPEVFHQGYTVLLCLRVAEELVRASTAGVKTYLVGFDFEVNEANKDIVNMDYRQANFSSQRRALRTILSKKHLLKNSIIHIGFDAICDLTPDVHNRLNSSYQASDGLASPRPPEVEIVAEITTNHFGDWDRLEQMVRRAKLSGADSVKFQKRNTDTFYSQEKLASAFESPFGDSFGDYRRALELDVDGFLRLDSLCTELDIKWFASVLDIKSFDFMLQFEPTRVKLPSTISEHTDLLDHVSANFKHEIVVSTGFTDDMYERKVRELFRKSAKLYLLQCVSAYPARNFETQIAVVRHYHDLSREFGSNVVPGYSSHDIGSLVSMMAVAAGAKMIEKHVKLGDSEWAHFDEVAVDLSGDHFNKFTRDIRSAEAILGGSLKKIQKSEHHKYWV